MKPDYKNWVPKGMVLGLAAGTVAACVLFILFGATDWIAHGTARVICAVVLGVGTLAGGVGEIMFQFIQDGRHDRASVCNFIERTVRFVMNAMGLPDNQKEPLMAALKENTGGT